MALKTLDKRVVSSNKENKTDFKEWVPIYGIYQTIKNSNGKKPNATDKSNFYFSLYFVYHFAMIYLSVLGINHFLEKFN